MESQEELKEKVENEIQKIQGEIIQMSNSFGKGLKEEIKEKQFRFQNQRAFFTYPTHINKEEYTEWLSIRTNTGLILGKNIHIAHEQASSKTNYAHTHVVVDFGKCVQTRNCRFFDYLDIPHPNIAFLKTKKDYENCLRYINKELPLSLCEPVEKC